MRLDEICPEMHGNEIRGLNVCGLLRKRGQGNGEKYHLHSWVQCDGGQTREIYEKLENYFKGKVFIFAIQSMILKQYPVNLVTYLELY